MAPPVVLPVLFLCVICVAAETVQVKTPSGIFVGQKMRMKDIEVQSFLGVPYADRMNKERRYKEAVEYQDNYQQTISCQTLPHSCPQEEMKLFDHFIGEKAWQLNTPIDENCLFLNIWQPVHKHDKTKKPVIVWIHGGGFVVGTSTVEITNGTILAVQADAVVVSFQYRLGALGFLYTGDNFAPGNAGLKDQVSALKWVQKNIEYFGGDKEKVTLVGVSAGGASVGYHLLSEETSKLFKRAIIIGGTPNADWAHVSPSEAAQRALGLAAKLGANLSNHDDIKRNLQEREWRQITKAQATSLAVALSMPFVPTTESVLVPEHPIRLMNTAYHLRNKEVIVEWAKDEGSVFLLMALKMMKIIKEPLEFPQIHKEQYDEIILKFTNGNHEIATSLGELYNKSETQPYLNGLINLYSDHAVKCPSNQFVEKLRKRGARVYQAEYNYRTSNNPWPLWIGVMHGSDTEVLFGLPKYLGMEYSPNDQFVSNTYLERIKNFVYHGDPNVAERESWYKEKIFTIGMGHQANDDRIAACAKLKKAMPYYLSGSLHLNYGLPTIFFMFATILVLI